MLAKFDGEWLPDLRPVPAGARSSGNVGYWHKADIPSSSINVRFWGKADIEQTIANVRF